jgi:transcriptional regulator with XRE-family HTH domain
MASVKRGKHLRKLRKSAGLSINDMGRAMGVDRSAVSHWERGMCRPRDLVRYARAVKVSVETVLAAG